MIMLNMLNMAMHGESRPRFESRTELACVFVSSRVSCAAATGVTRGRYGIAYVPSCIVANY